MGFSTKSVLSHRIGLEKKMYYPFSKECPLQLVKYIRVLYKISDFVCMHNHSGVSVGVWEKGDGRCWLFI